MSNALSQMNLLNLAHILPHTFHSTVIHNQRDKSPKQKAKTLVWISRTWKTIEWFLTSGFHGKAIQLLKKLSNSAILLAFKSYHKQSANNFQHATHTWMVSWLSVTMLSQRAYILITPRFTRLFFTRIKYWATH